MTRLYESKKNSKTVVARTATMELTPAQSELVERAKAGGTLSLALRALGDSETAAVQTKQISSGNNNSDRGGNRSVIHAMASSAPPSSVSEGEPGAQLRQVDRFFAAVLLAGPVLPWRDRANRR